MQQENQNGYRKLLVWQKADELTFQVYSTTKNFPKDELFGLISQMRRAAVSVPANIVEGYARFSKKEKSQFYNIAHGSLTELEYYLDLSFRLKYISDNEHSQLTNLRSEVGRLLNGLMKKNRSLSLVSIFLILVACFMSLVASSASAASFILNASSTVPVNQDFKVDFMIDTEGQNLNAFEGVIYFPNPLLEIKQINDGDSVVNFWVERPHFASSTDPLTDAIIWSGITPQGFQGMLGPYAGEKPGKLFSITFSPHGIGSGQITTSNLRALIEDGQGSPANVSAVPLSFAVNEASGKTVPAYRDLNPPESFRSEIARDPTIFDGRYFLVFLTQDKETGIERYEVMESRDKTGATGEWIRAESPYLLKDQGLSSFTFVKAVDKAGNERVEIIGPGNAGPGRYRNMTPWIIIITLIAFIALIGYSKKWKKEKH